MRRAAPMVSAPPFEKILFRRRILAKCERSGSCSRFKRIGPCVPARSSGNAFDNSGSAFYSCISSISNQISFKGIFHHDSNCSYRRQWSSRPSYCCGSTCRGFEVTAFVRGSSAPAAQHVVHKDVLAIEQSDLTGFDAVVDALGFWTLTRCRFT